MGSIKRTVGVGFIVSGMLGLGASACGGTPADWDTPSDPHTEVSPAEPAVGQVQLAVQRTQLPETDLTDSSYG
jgi:hypothetical protein